jgi:hypothetical protein
MSLLKIAAPDYDKVRDFSILKTSAPLRQRLTDIATKGQRSAVAAWPKSLAAGT